jgi:alkylhydroperoxidase family enzyme
MSAGSFDRDTSPALHKAAAAAAYLLLTVCAGPQSSVVWVKPGADDAAVSREIDDCQTQANRALARQQGVNQDISATLGRNWQMSGTTSVRDQSMQQGAAGVADQVFNSCMRAKGFKKQG